MADNADWSDENLRVVCELFAAEVRAKNRSGTHLNRQGYANVIAHFKEKTRLSYAKLQFRNKWDKLRKDYSNRKQLQKETRSAWDPTLKTFNALDWWWKKINKQYKGSAKFKGKKLEHEDELGIMFEDLQNTGDDHWAPSSGQPPQDTKGQ
ncbi:unnamed protein product [Urochloa humidicola]